MAWYSKANTFAEDVHKDTKKKSKWESRYFRLRPGDEILYIEVGLYTLGGCTYKEQYGGIILCTNRHQIQFRVRGYRNHKDPYKIPPKIQVDEESGGKCQTIILNKADFRCLNTDTTVIKDSFVYHLKENLSPEAYWILARETFMRGYINLEYQKKKCRYGKKCNNVRIDHLVQWKHKC